MNEYHNKVISCIRRVKEQIKINAINYQTIADRLNVSLLTVKRQLNGEDISLSKLLALCDAAEINFADVWQFVDEASVVHTFINKAQDRAFYDNPHLFHFFIALFQQKKTLEEIQQQWKLTPSSLHLYLRKLELLELISISAKQKISFRVKEPIGFGPDSKVVRKEISSVLSQMSEVCASEQALNEFLVSKPMQMSKDLRQKMHQDLFDVISRYAELSERYFAQSEEPTFNLLACDFQTRDFEKQADIINITSFK